MIYTSEKGIRTIMLVFLLGFFFVTMFFIKEMKKIENIYDNIAEETMMGL